MKPCPSCKFSCLETTAEVIEVKKLLDRKNYPKGHYHILGGLQDQSFLVSACFDAHIFEKHSYKHYKPSLISSNTGQ